MKSRTDHVTPEPNRAEAERIREIGCTLWAPGDWLKHMAEALNIDRRTIQRWAAGEIKPGADIFAALRGIAAVRCREIAAVVK